MKEINQRVKGSEKFWNDGDSGDAILHLRAALIGDTDELPNHITHRPRRYYTRRTRHDKQPAQP